MLLGSQGAKAQNRDGVGTQDSEKGGNMWEEDSWHRMTDTIWGVGYKLRTGVPRGRIVAELMSAGATEEQANGFIDYVIDVSTRQENTARQQSAQGWGRDVGYGVTLWVAGGLFTLGSYLLAKWWGTYWIATGAFVVGGFYILRGLYGLCKEFISLRIRQENAPR